MKKAMFFGTSNILIYIALFLVVLLLMGAMYFDKQAKEEVIEGVALDIKAETMIMSFMRQRAEVDTNGDGHIDTETMADLIIKGHDKDEHEFARDEMARRGQEFLEKVNTEDDYYGFAIIYPNKAGVLGNLLADDIQIGTSIFSRKGTSYVGAFYLPLPDGQDVKIKVATVYSTERNIKAMETEEW
ncbi:hypothetical protein ACFL1B_06525 [Nanoarchaeota archaeon]